MNKNKKFLKSFLTATFVVMFLFSNTLAIAHPVQTYNASGMKFNDLDGNGIKTCEEPGLKNWTITITGPDGFNKSTKTDNSGNYQFTGLKAGTYTICEILKDDWEQTGPTEEMGGVNGCYVINITNKNINNLDFGNREIQEPETATILANKIVCQTETDLPNWGDGSGPAMITETTAATFLLTHPNCNLEPGWDFQWGFEGVKQPGDHIGPAPDGTGWNNFNTSTTELTPAQVEISDLDDATRIWVRENLKEGYVPFSNPPGDLQNNISAEMWCHNDILNYDNYDYINNPKIGETYYCLAFNAPVSGPEPYCGDGIKNGNEECDGTDGVPEHYICTQECTLEYIPFCGDQIVNDGEICEIGNTQACEVDGYQGNQPCNQDCMGWGECIPTESCGDGIINDSEQCDDGTQNGESCIPPYGGSCQYCSNVCILVNVNGPFCGDQIINDGETCEIGNTQSCQTQSGYTGNQTCQSDCMGWDECETQEYCGDNILNGNEVCELLQTQECQTQEGYSGVINCISDCSGWDSECNSNQYCGDGEINGEEQECIPEGQSGPVVPDGLSCCPGLVSISCDAPDQSGNCPAERCVGAFYCTMCGDDVCGAGENECNCPEDCHEEECDYKCFAPDSLDDTQSETISPNSEISLQTFLNNNGYSINVQNDQTPPSTLNPNT